MIDIPPTWRKGALLNLKRYSDGTYRATLLGDCDDPKKDYIAPAVTFENSYTAQQWISEWYQPVPQQWSG